MHLLKIPGGIGCCPAYRANLIFGSRLICNIGDAEIVVSVVILRIAHHVKMCGVKPRVLLEVGTQPVASEAQILAGFMLSLSGSSMREHPVARFSASSSETILGDERNGLRTDMSAALCICNRRNPYATFTDKPARDVLL